ncbi:MAG: TlpA family protein disulfide reductase [Methylococcaceae bacterium]
MQAVIGQKAPLLSVAAWVQGEPVNFDQLIGQVVLVEVFQVNCPGCFLYALPEAIALHNRYQQQGLTVLGVATAFEDFDKNTLENLTRLAEKGEVIGETLRWLRQHEELIAGKLPYRIPFPLAMDNLNVRQDDVTDEVIAAFIKDRVPGFALQPAAAQNKIWEQVREYLQALEYHADTFEIFALKGTPSAILVDKQGILRDCRFGASSNLEADILTLLQE